MARPQRLKPDEEKDLKFWLLNGIEANRCRDTKALAQFMRDSNLKPQQVQYYLNKFHLSFKYPYAFNDDLIEYEIWWDQQEAKGTWFGDKTTFEAIIKREHEFAGSDNSWSCRVISQHD